MLEPFWKSKTLEQMSDAEWESLCDGCALCCLQKLEDEDTGEVHYTHLVCRYLDSESCRCGDYRNRSKLVPNCVWLTRENIDQFHWLPATCAYRLVAQNKELPDWHPLISGSSDSVHEAGVSVKGKTLSEEYVHPDEWEYHLIDWVQTD